MTIQNSELLALEAQIKEMEDRLKRSQGQGQGQGQGRGAIPNYDAKPAENKTLPTRQKDESAEMAKSRPGSSRTARPAPSSGDMPPTPVASEGEYDVVDRADLEDDEPARPHA